MGVQSILPLLIRLALAVEGAQATKTVKDSISAPTSLPSLYSSGNGIYAKGMPYNDPSYSASQLVPVKEETVVIQNNNGFLRDSYGNNFLESPQKFAYKMTLPQQYVKLQDLPLHLSQPLSYPSAPQISYGTPIKSSLQSSNPFHFSTSAFSDIQALAPNARLAEGLGAHSPQHLSSNQKPIYTNKQPYKYVHGNENIKNTKYQGIEQQTSNPNGNPNSKANYQKYNKASLKKAPASSAPQKHYIVIKNGKKTPITIATNAPLPHLLDVSLLKPLKFSNPIVPQVQHYLPKINYHVPKVDEEIKQHNEFVVTKTKSYDTGPINEEASNDNSGENDSSEEHDNDHSYEEEGDTHREERLQKPPTQKSSIRVSGSPTGPEHKYEIVSPSFKETFSSQVMNYDKKGQDNPIVYSYDMKIQKKPVQYSITHSSKTPPTHSNQVLIKEVHNGVPTRVFHSDSPNRSHEHDYDDDHSMEYEEAPRQRPRQRDQVVLSPQRPSHHLRAEHREVQYHIQPKPLQNPVPYDAAQHQLALPLASPPTQTFRQSNVPQNVQINLQPFQLEEIQYVPVAAPHQQVQGHQSQGVHHNLRYNNQGQNQLNQDFQHHLKHNNQNQIQQHHSFNQNLQQLDNRLHENNGPVRHASHETNLESYVDHGGPPRDQNYERVQGNHGYNFGHPDSRPTSKPHSIHESYRNNQQNKQNDAIKIHPESNQNRHHEDHSYTVNHAVRPNSKESFRNSQEKDSLQSIHDSAPNNEQQFIKQFHEQFPQLNGFQPYIGQIKVDSSSTPRKLPQQNSVSTYAPPPPSSSQQSYSTPVTTTYLNQPYSSPATSTHHTNEPYSTPVTTTQSGHSYSSPTPSTLNNIVEKSRKIIIQEETPDELHSHKEATTASMVDQEENNEEDFEKLYKEAAFGFPAYNNDRETLERDIYNPDSYASDHHVKFDAENTPFQQYVEEGDEFPKSARLNYKDSQDNTKEDYFLDYSLNRPQSDMDRYKHQVEYYKMFKKDRQPNNWGVIDEQQPKESYTAYGYAPQQKEEKKKSFFEQYKNSPNFEYEYSKEAPRDALAHASKSSHKVKTFLVEPQFQYGFEPIAIPNLFDSELAAMASNDSPKSDKDGIRKKVYKEDWYIKKTTLSGLKPAR